MRLGTILIIALVTLTLVASPAAAHSSSESVPPGDAEGPGVVVRQITLAEDDAVDWSWSSSDRLDFEVTVLDDGTPVVLREAKTSQAGHLLADRAGVYVFQWSNDDLGKESSYSKDYVYKLAGRSESPKGWRIVFDAKPDLVGLWNRIEY